MTDRAMQVWIPNVEAMSDEEVAAFARDRDGRWSAQTKDLLRRFDTDRLDLNSWWALTGTGWSCPCCKRSKVDIARPGPNGVLLCRLELHHDHLGNHARKLFDVENPKLEGDPLKVNHQLANAKDALMVFVERFEAALICADCNAADGKAKGALKPDISNHFTFAPAEIEGFIRIRPNQVHDVDVAKAREAWTAAREDFEDRVDFAKRMGSRVARGKHRRTPFSRAILQGFDDRHFVWFQVTEQFPQLHEPPVGLGAGGPVGIQ